MVKKNRRTFLHMALASIVVLFLLLWNKVTLNHIDLTGRKKKVFPFDKKKSVSFIDDYIVINENKKSIVLSAHCTHLGCKINKIENDRLICPCHGSEYNLKGIPIKGPAFKNLEKISSKISSDGMLIEINN